MNRNLIMSYETEDATRNTLLRYALGRFEWKNLPWGLTSHKLETYLFFNGSAIAFQQGKLRILPCQPSGSYNEYGIPVGYIAQAYNTTYNTDINKGVLIHGSVTHKGYKSLLEGTAAILNECMNAIRINVRMQKNPWVFGGTKDEVKSLQACFERVQENGIVMYTTENTLSQLETAKRFFPVNTPLIASDLYRVHRETLNAFLTELGLDNVPVEKKERLISDEAHGNDCAILYNRQDQLNHRKNACKEINRKFGTNISVEWKGCEVDASAKPIPKPE